MSARGDDGELVPYAAEQEAIREMIALRAQRPALRRAFVVNGPPIRAKEFWPAHEPRKMPQNGVRFLIVACQTCGHKADVNADP